MIAREVQRTQNYVCSEQCLTAAELKLLVDELESVFQARTSQRSASFKEILNEPDSRPFSNF